MRRQHAAMAWGLAVSLLAHALLVYALPDAPDAQQARPRRASEHGAGRVAVRLVTRLPPTPTVGDAHQLVARASPPVPSARRPTAHRAARRQPMLQAAAASAPAETPIDGSVFALPRIGFATDDAPARWSNALHPPSRQTDAPPPGVAPPPPMQVHAPLESIRRQITSALQQQLSTLPPPADAAEGRCALHAQPEPRLHCDSSALQRTVLGQLVVLASLLDAYTRVDPRAESIAIEFRQGRYSVAPNRASEAP